MAHQGDSLHETLFFPLFLTAENNIQISGLEEHSMCCVHAGVSKSENNIEMLCSLNISYFFLKCVRIQETALVREIYVGLTLLGLFGNEAKYIKQSGDFLKIICQV